MYTFPELIKKIRDESGFTQNEFAKVLGVSTVLISMIETGQKGASKGFIKKLAGKLEVPISTISPFIFEVEEKPFPKLSGLEKKLIDMGSKMQLHLIRVKSKKLKQYAKG
jgi:transcriptional regulator with XRE-family HTH domain